MVERDASRSPPREFSERFLNSPFTLPAFFFLLSSLLLLCSFPRELIPPSVASLFGAGSVAALPPPLCA